MLHLLNADPAVYDLVFTANATGGIKLVAEAFGTLDSWNYVYLQDSHTSIVGVRELATTFTCCNGVEMNEYRSSLDDTTLVAYPAQSNFNGKRFPLDWCRKQHENHYTLLDAASLMTSSLMNLGDPNSPDFVVFSFYKMFGWPDLGGLVVKKSTAHLFARRRYFGGGTVASLSSSEKYHEKRVELHSQLEDGTCAFHSIIAISIALEVFKSLYGSFDNISQHTQILSVAFTDMISRLRHYNGRPVVQLFTDGDYSNLVSQGPIVNFNILNADSTWVGHAEFEKLAAVRNIHLRTGGLCNPGGVEKWIGLSTQDVKRNFSLGHVCWDDNDLVDGKPTGSIRVSFGPMNIIEDVVTLVRLIEEFYMKSTFNIVGDQLHPASNVKLTDISVYPIKSCHAFSVPPNIEWPLTQFGLLYDRCFFVVHLGTLRSLSLKLYPNLTFIRPEIRLSKSLLIVKSPMSSTTLSISLDKKSSNVKHAICKVFGDSVNCEIHMNAEVSKFFSNIVGVPCTLARLSSDSPSRYAKGNRISLNTPLLLSNESPFLIINKSSFDAVAKYANLPDMHPSVFRANLTIDGHNIHPFEEDAWKSLIISGCNLEVSQVRTNIDPFTMQKVSNDLHSPNNK